jgi:hypothetical protein
MQRGKLQVNVIWDIGTEEGIAVAGQPWFDDWEVTMVRGEVTTNITVAQCLACDSASWDMGMLTQVGGLDLATEISRRAPTPIARPEMMDRLIWKPAKSGIYTVKLGYQ